MATVCVSIIRPIGRLFHITTVKAVHPLTFLSLPASDWAGPRLPASASRIQPPFRELTSSQSIKACHQTSFLPAFFERLKLSTRRKDSLNCKLHPISFNRAVWRRVPVQ